MKHVLLTGAALLSMSAGAAHAQTQAAAASRVAEVVVTATSTERDLVDAPASVSVIQREDLMTRPVLDLSDALRDVPGVTVTGIGLTRRGISVRGMPEEHTLVLIDGRRVNSAADAVAHADFDIGWTPVEAIERIEVVRGPLSSLYGSDALGGVVNVITRKATDVWRGSALVSGTTLDEGHGGDTYQFGAYLGGPLIKDRLGISLIAEARGQDDLPTEADPQISAIEGRDSRTASATLSWTPDAAQRIDATYLVGRDERRRDTATSGARPTYYVYEDDIRREQMSLSHFGDWSWSESEVKAYRSELERENSVTVGTPTRPTRLVDTIVDGRLSLEPLRGHRVTFGGEHRWERLDDTSASLSGTIEAKRYALFLQDEAELTDRWSVVAGARFDHHPEYGWQTSPRAYTIFHATDRLTFKGGVGRGFKSPTLKQLSPEYSAVGGGGMFTIYGTPDLEPEIATTYEAGVEFRTGAGALRATIFQNDVEDLIETYCVSSCGVRGREIRRYRNVAEARIRGVELSGDIDLPKGFDLGANYTRLDTEDLATGLELAERPEQSANAKLGWTAGDFRAQARVDYVGEQVVVASGRRYPLPDYTLVAVDVSQRLTPNLTLRGGVENLTNEQLVDLNSRFTYAEPGRRFHLGLNLSF